MSHDLREKFAQIVHKYAALEAVMAAGSISIDQLTDVSREYSKLTPLVDEIKNLETVECDIQEWQNALSDAEMKSFAEAELARLRHVYNESFGKIKVLLIPTDPDDTKNAILEIRAGTGGDEASLFASDLFNMYKGYAAQMSWKYEVIQSSLGDLGGIKEIIISVQGQDVFSKLKFESGVHRVQRVPATETAGRIHTSAATVAVLPEVAEIDVNIKAEDLRIDCFRSSGPGGQSVNTTDSAVRITHLPTGIVVSQQDEKSQHKNKAKALKILQARVYQAEKDKQDKERSADRKNQIGTGDRSERIRTYNFHENRLTDHRINFTIYRLTSILTGEYLHEVIDALIAYDQASKLTSLEE
jgi:peptide chain release factor 1